MIDIIVRQKFFGKVLVYVYVIKFQKRRLPYIISTVFYTIRSKVCSWDSLKVYLGNNNLNQVKNYVYKEVGETGVSRL